MYFVLVIIFLGLTFPLPHLISNLLPDVHRKYSAGDVHDSNNFLPTNNPFPNHPPIYGHPPDHKPLWSKVLHKNSDSTVAAIVAKTISMDTHNHIDVPLDTNELPGPEIDLNGEMKKSGLSAIVMTFATDYKRNVQPGEAYQRFLNCLTAMDAMLQNNNMKRLINLANVHSAHNNDLLTVILAVEGCHFLEGNPDRVEVAYKRGLRHLGLLHDSDA